MAWNGRAINYKGKIHLVSVSAGEIIESMSVVWFL
jgi:hypothetical protein